MVHNARQQKRENKLKSKSNQSKALGRGCRPWEEPHQKQMKGERGKKKKKQADRNQIKSNQNKGEGSRKEEEKRRRAG